MSLAQRARVVERSIFGALIGALVGLVLCRLAVFAIDVHLYGLVASLLIGAWSGIFISHFGLRRSLQTLQSMRVLAVGFRSICLRFILWLLGIAAVLGVLAVLTGSFEVVGRVAATTAVTALAAVFLWPFLRLFDDDSKWKVGLFGIVSVMAAYMLGMPSIWNIGYQTEESALSGLTVALMMPVGLVAMHLSQSVATRVSGFLATLLYAGVSTLFLLAIWMSDNWNSASRLVEAAFITLPFGALGVVTMINALTGDRRYWRWLGFTLTVVAAAMCIANVWEPRRFDEKWITAITSFAVVFAHANLAVLAPLKLGQGWWRYATILAMVVTAVALDAELLLDPPSSRGISLLGRIALASGIIASTGTLALLILTRLNRSVAPIVTANGEISTIELSCPSCGMPQTVPLGESACHQCGLRFSIRVRTAR